MSLCCGGKTIPRFSPQETVPTQRLQGSQGRRNRYRMHSFCQSLHEDTTQSGWTPDSFVVFRSRPLFWHWLQFPNCWRFGLMPIIGMWQRAVEWSFQSGHDTLTSEVRVHLWEKNFFFLHFCNTLASDLQLHCPTFRLKTGASRNEDGELKEAATQGERSAA